MSKLKHFQKLIDCLPLHCVSILLNKSRLHRSMYIIDNLHSPARLPHFGEVPWPIMVAAAGVSLKHIPRSKEFHSKAISAGIEQFMRKLVWRWHFKSDSSANIYGCNKIASRFPTIPYKWPIPGDIRAIGAEINNIARKAMHRASHIARETQPQAFLFKRVRLLLDSASAHLVPTDKDGGFCYVKDVLLKRGFQNIISSGDYVCLKPNVQEIHMRYRRLCKAWATHFCMPGLVGKLTKSLQYGDSLTSVLSLNAKTHKPKISFRNLHLSAGWVLQGLSRFVSNILQEFLNGLDHILVNTSDLVRKLERTEYDCNSKFAQLDIQHFFMTGEEHELSELASRPFKGKPLYDLLRNSILFLLQAQFVHVKHTNQTLRVIKGTGMGLPHSGAVAETAFYSAGEAELLQSRHLHGISLYARFKDDVIIIYRDFDRFRNFTCKLKHNNPFVVTCESISSVSVTFLEVRISKYKHRFVTVPVSKASALGTPWLGRESNHPVQVHNSWPTAHLKHRLSLCSLAADKVAEHKSYLQRAKDQSLSNFSIAQISKFDPLHKLSNIRTMHPIGDSRRKKVVKSLWLVLPYGPVLKSAGLGQQISNFFAKSWGGDLLRYLFNCNCQVRIAWRNRSPTVAQLLKYKLKKE